MKLRIRFNSKTRIIDINETENIASIKDHVKNYFELTSDNFNLSLNNSTPLETDLPIKSIGVVSGDLIHILVDDLGSSEITTSSSSMSTNSKDQQNSSNLASTCFAKSKKYSSIRESAMNQETVKSSTGYDVETAKILERPASMREATNEIDAEYPEILEELVMQNKNAIKDLNDAILLPMHAIMIESGFKRVKVDDKNNLILDCRHAPVYNIIYQHSQRSACNKFILMCCPMSGKMIINASVTWERKDDPPITDFKFRPADFIRDITTDNLPVYYNLKRFYFSFKSNIVNWMIRTLQKENDVIDTAALDVLPHELQLMIVGKMDYKARLRLMMTCKHFYKMIAEDNYGWRRLYLKDYGRRTNNNTDQNWKNIYCNECQSMRSSTSSPMRNYYGIPEYSNIRRGPIPSNTMQPPIRSDFIGGEYDLRPDFSGGNFGMSMRPRFDPAYPFQMRPPNPNNPIWDPDGGGNFGMQMRPRFDPTDPFQRRPPNPNNPNWDPDGPNGGEFF